MSEIASRLQPVGRPGAGSAQEAGVCNVPRLRKPPSGTNTGGLGGGGLGGGGGVGVSGGVGVGGAASFGGSRAGLDVHKAAKPGGTVDDLLA